MPHSDCLPSRFVAGDRPQHKRLRPVHQDLNRETKRWIGFLFWNAANDYSKPYKAMPEMKAANAASNKR